MTQHDDLLYLGHMRDTIRTALRLVEDRDKTSYDADETLQYALVHLVQIIGEAARQVSPEKRSSLPAIPWHQIIGMRHRIVHDYINIDTDIVWEVVSVELEPLLAELTRVVPENPPE